MLRFTLPAVALLVAARLALAAVAPQPAATPSDPAADALLPADKAIPEAVDHYLDWDVIYRDLILADDSAPGKKGSSQFLRSRVRDLDRLTTDVSVLFFGVNISCAQCHDHPLVADWKQDHFYGLKSFFARTFEVGPTLGEREFAPIQFKTTKGVTRQAKLMFLTGKVIDVPGAKPLTPEELKRERTRRKGRAPAGKVTPPKFSARAKLAEVALQPDQRDFFARAIVNRVWHRL
jgi:hypothetical protein